MAQLTYKKFMFQILGLGNGPLSLNRVASGSADNDVFPFGFQGSLTIMCLGHPENPATRCVKCYTKTKDDQCKDIFFIDFMIF